MGKHTDKLGSYDSFVAPWETEAGADAEIEKPKLKRLIWNLKSTEAKALDAREDDKTALADAEKALEEAKAELASANGDEAQKKIDKLQKQVDDFKAADEKRAAEKDAADLKAEVIGDLDPKYAKYVVGTTQEELEKSLESVRADFDLPEPGEGDDDDDDAPVVRTTPRSRLKNPVDPLNGKGGEAELDANKIADQILGNSIFG